VGILLAGFAFLAYAVWTYKESGSRSGLHFWATFLGCAVAGALGTVGGLAQVLT
jgi:hypothetical protein